jgi:chemotaxis protein CheZ
MSITLEQRIAALEASLKGTAGGGKADGDMIPAKDVWALIDAVKAMFGQDTGSRSEIFHELGNLAQFINQTRKELSEAKKDHIADKELPDAESQLDAIVSMTEQATGKIMDACDNLSNFHNDMRERLIAMDPPLNPDALAGVEDAMTQAQTSITHIYEACNFQDITGQRIQKVVKLLQDIERKVLRLVVTLGLAEKNESLDEDTKAHLNEDAALLNGPSIPGQGLEQDEIDAILAKLL